MLKEFQTAMNGPLFLTGHTGFKGAWMTMLLKSLGVRVFGYSLPPKKGSIFQELSDATKVDGCFENILNKEALLRTLNEVKPQVVVHFAAQPLVLDSYKMPLQTFEVNVTGTLNVVDAACMIDSVQVILIITTDKVYRNLNSGRRFCESDPLQGSDPYSASKVAAESICHAWQKVYSGNPNKKIIVARAGNVIGGGDMNENRLIPDIIHGATTGKPVQIRNPNSVRPWQHVLDPLFGYLLYIQKSLGAAEVPPALNFGPLESSKKVMEIVDIAKKYVDVDFSFPKDATKQTLEAEVLDLDSGLARTELNWVPRWNQEEAIHKTFSWWTKVLQGKSSVFLACNSDIHHFLNLEPGSNSSF